MAEQLHSTIKIDNTEYEVVAKTAEKVAVPLTIKVVNGDTKEYIFDGSSDPKVEIKAVEDAGHAGNADYAKEAGKVTNALTIKTIVDGKETTTTFDGSEPNINITIGDANKIKVNMPDHAVKASYATITISEEDPVNGATGDIWFKY